MSDPTAPAGAAAPEPPPAAAAVFGAELGRARAYADLLASDGIVRGMIGPREVPRIWSRHLLNCAASAELCPADGRVVDLGSGAGLPGIPMALARPDLTVSLVEPMMRRVVFLREVVTALGLDRVSVVHARAEQLAPSPPGYDVVVARAVTHVSRLAAWALPLLRPAGSLVALKGARASDELLDAQESLRSLGAASWRVGLCGRGMVEPPTTVVVVTAGAAAPARSGAKGQR